MRDRSGDQGLKDLIDARVEEGEVLMVEKDLAMRKPRLNSFFKFVNDVNALTCSDKSKFNLSMLEHIEYFVEHVLLSLVHIVVNILHDK